MVSIKILGGGMGRGGLRLNRFYGILLNSVGSLFKDFDLLLHL